MEVKRREEHNAQEGLEDVITYPDRTMQLRTLSNPSSFYQSENRHHASRPAEKLT